MQKTIEGFRLSPQQARINSFQQQSNVYRAECEILIEGLLDSKRLRSAFEQILINHEIYRTSFPRLPGMKTPVQHVQADLSYTWREVDISSCLPEQQELQATLLQEERACNLEDAYGESLLHCLLIDLGCSRHLLLIYASALRVDIQTLRRLMQDLANFYLKGSGEIEFTDQGQYTQFSEWQHQLLEEENGEQSTWPDEDVSSLSAISLPFEKRSREPDRFAPALLSVQLETPQLARLNAWLALQQRSFAEFLLACWLVLLWRQTGYDELIIGVGIDGRIYEELAEIAGPMVKYLPMRQRLADGKSFNELLTDVQAAYDELPARYPYFSWDTVSSSDIPPWYAFCFEAYDQPVPARSNDVTFALERCYTCPEPYKFKLLVTGSLLEWHYDASLFQEQDVRCLSRQLLTLIEAAIEQAEAPVGDLSLLSQDERELVLKTFNQQSAPYPRDACLHHLFEWQVEKTPDAIALQHADEFLTYGQLNAQANQLAHYLCSLNVGPEITVGLYLERSSRLLIAILAILKAGGAYVPLDPLYPPERLAYITDDAQLSLLLTSRKLQATAPRLAGEIVVLEQIWPALARLDTRQAPPAEVRPENLAYVLYTSGSTGQPKGVMIPHQGVVQYIHWCSSAYQLASGNGAPIHSPLAFDLTVTSLFAPLIVGQRLLLVPEEEGVEALSKLLRWSPHFSLLKITPAHLELLTRALNPQKLATVANTLVIGGEALYSEHLALWREYAPEVRLINEYGPTETVVGCCVYEVAGDSPASGNLPIGRPLPNVRLYVLDQQLQPAAIGIIGEIYISGIGVGRGYLRRPDLTAERFLPEPYSKESGTRMYRTGDLGRYCSASGDMEYLGRVDRQVKLRGFRIELGEIEAVLLRHPQVQEAAVLLREDEPGKPQLVAYLVSASRSAPALTELQETIQRYLPAYMLP
ncbi:MAG TPA: amino acid adenylation domain-containing protein, partial [Ktedonobacteraceae bacterium]|nr:amino acid adenylation domain-containing protein [Ktedonobacteraceae bacterium]